MTDTASQLSLITPARRKGTKGDLKARILRALGERSMTDQELARALRVSGNSIRPRRGELLSAGAIVCVGKRRPPGKRSMYRVYATPSLAKTLGLVGT